MIHVALYEPEIPPNTGNIIRLCANTGATLHLVGKLGFEMDDARLRRAGLDYHEYADVHQHVDLQALMRALPDGRVLPFTTKGRKRFSDVKFSSEDVLLFGPESRGLPAVVLGSFPAEHLISIPQRACSRSLNLSNAVAIAVYEAWRQMDFVVSR